MNVYSHGEKNSFGKGARAEEGMFSELRYIVNSGGVLLWNPLHVFLFTRRHSTRKEVDHHAKVHLNTIPKMRRGRRAGGRARVETKASKLTMRLRYVCGSERASVLPYYQAAVFLLQARVREVRPSFTSGGRVRIRCPRCRTRPPCRRGCSSTPRRCHLRIMDEQPTVKLAQNI